MKFGNTIPILLVLAILFAGGCYVDRPSLIEKRNDDSDLKTPAAGRVPGDTVQLNIILEEHEQNSGFMVNGLFLDRAETLKYLTKNKESIIGLKYVGHDKAVRDYQLPVIGFIRSLDIPVEWDLPMGFDDGTD